MKKGLKKQQFSSQNPKYNSSLQLKRTIRTKLHTQQSYPNFKTNHNNSNIIGHNQQLINRIKNNYQDLKSVLPTNLSDNIPKQSIKTYNKQKYAQISGAAYLMIKSKISKDHPQKKHLNQTDYCQKNNNTEFKQKRHYQQSYKQKQNRMEQLNNVPRKHSQTLYKKIDNDLYSKIEFKQNLENLTVKMSDKNMFKTGKDLGYDAINKPKVTQAKKRELIGSNMLAKPTIQKNKRDDWIKSSIVFG